MNRSPRTRRPKTVERPSTAGRDRDILLVEADPEQQVPLAHALRERGLRVVAVSSVAGALALTGRYPVDLVLVSQELPSTTGVDVIRTLKDRCAGTRALLMTNEGSPGLLAAAIEAGAQGCVTRSEAARTAAQLLRASARDSFPPASLDLDGEVTAQSAE